MNLNSNTSIPRYLICIRTTWALLNFVSKLAAWLAASCCTAAQNQSATASDVSSTRRSPHSPQHSAQRSPRSEPHASPPALPARCADCSPPASVLLRVLVVRVERLVKDRQYKKYVRRYSRFMAHDEQNDCNVGDKVRIIEHRPLSKRKRWKVQETVVRATGV